MDILAPSRYKLDLQLFAKKVEGEEEEEEETSSTKEEMPAWAKTMQKQLDKLSETSSKGNGKEQPQNVTVPPIVTPPQTEDKSKDNQPPQTESPSSEPTKKKSFWDFLL